MKWFSIFDKAEDKVRFTLSHYPILYALIVGLGSVLFFRGIWLIADEMTFMTGPVTLLISVTILLLTGSLVYHFISDDLIISGIKKKKKINEKIARKRRSSKKRS